MTAISERNCEKFLCKSVRRRSEPDRLIALHWPLATVWQLRIRRAKGTEHWVAEKLTPCKSMLGAEWKGKWLSTDTPHDRGSSSSICWPPASAKNRNTKIPSVESDIGLWNKSIKSNQGQDGVEYWTGIKNRDGDSEAKWWSLNWNQQGKIRDYNKKPWGRWRLLRRGASGDCRRGRR